MTQVLARTTTLLDGRKNVKMTGRVYLRAIVPIGLFFSLSLICGNLTYLYLSVAFIQMLKVSLGVSPMMGRGGYASANGMDRLLRLWLSSLLLGVLDLRNRISKSFSMFRSLSSESSLRPSARSGSSSSDSSTKLVVSSSKPSVLSWCSVCSRPQNSKWILWFHSTTSHPSAPS